MTTMAAEHTVRGRTVADREAFQRLLNSWLRETGVIDPRIARTELARRFPGLEETLPRGEAAFVAELEPGRALVIGTQTVFSRVGLHVYGDTLWLWDADTRRVEPLVYAEQLAGPLVAATLARAGNTGDEVHAATFRRRIEDGIARGRIYAAHALSRGSIELDPISAQPMRAAEQALYFGHPFHPMAKSAQGFDAADLRRYAPELGTEFALVFFAAERAYLEESFLDAEYACRTERLLRRLAGSAAQNIGADQRLIPCHPWQANYLRRHPDTIALLKAGALTDLGQGEAAVFPTSSVRTVWCPSAGLFLKLALNVHITNFLRVNPPEQMHRSIDAARALKAAQPAAQYDKLHVLPEWGYRTVRAKDRYLDDPDALAASFGFLVREAPSGSLQGRPMVVAGLLEVGPRHGVPALIKALQYAAARAGRRLDAELAGDWVAAYAEIFLVPVLRLFTETGISLEAHVQNSMMVLDDGWPAAAFVRDLEGVSIAWGIGERAGILVDLAPDSPAIYSTDEAWHRFKYYVVVNHLGHLLAVLARFGPTAEVLLWRRVRKVLEQAKGGLGDGAQRYLDDLLSAVSLPAKANLLSCFRRRGDQPLYVDIPNPLLAEVCA